MKPKQNQAPKNIFFITTSIFLGVLTIIAIIFAVMAAGIFESVDDYGHKTFSVQGTGEAQAKPDTASFNITIEETAETSETATSVINTKAEAIITAVEEFGIKKEEITTNNYSVYEKFEWQPRENGGSTQVSVGWSGSQSLTFDIKDVEKAPEVLAELNKYNIRVNGPNYRVAYPEAAKEIARKEAIQNAKNQAQTLAADLGVKLGEMVSYYEVDNGYYPPIMPLAKSMAFDMELESAPLPSLPEGEDTITSTVELVFEFK